MKNFPHFILNNDYMFIKFVENWGNLRWNLLRTVIKTKMGEQSRTSSKHMTDQKKNKMVKWVITWNLFSMKKSYFETNLIPSSYQNCFSMFINEIRKYLYSFNTCVTHFLCPYIVLRSELRHLEKWVKKAFK